MNDLTFPWIQTYPGKAYYITDRGVLTNFEVWYFASIYQTIYITTYQNV